MAKVIESAIVELLKNKYGMTNLRKVLQYYGSGIPENYWMKQPEKNVRKAIDLCLETLDSGRWVALIGNTKTGAEISSGVIKEFIQRKAFVRQFDYLNLVGQLHDKFNQINLEVLKEFEMLNVISITNIKSGEVYNKMIGVFNSVLNSLTNTPLSKAVLLSIDFDGEIDSPEFEERYGGELVDILNNDFYSIKI